MSLYRMGPVAWPGIRAARSSVHPVPEHAVTDPSPENAALVIAAHPDDGDFGAAGYTAQLAARGWDVSFLVCTNGAKGTSDREMTRERLIALRREEQREACRRMGA